MIRRPDQGRISNLHEGLPPIKAISGKIAAIVTWKKKKKVKKWDVNQMNVNTGWKPNCHIIHTFLVSESPSWTSTVAPWVGVCLQLRGCRFHPLPRRIPHTVKQLSLCTASADSTHSRAWSPSYEVHALQLLRPAGLEPCSPAEQPPQWEAWGSLHRAMKTQHSHK